MVVDASVVVAGLLCHGNEGAWAEEALQQSPLLAPELVLVEATNVLRRLERADRISRDASALAFSDLTALALEHLPFAPFAQRIWELRQNFTSYDAWYVAVAEAAGCPLATLDRKLARAAQPHCACVPLPA